MTDDSSPDQWVTMTQIATRAGVTLSTVSNWRRRHDDFPAVEHRDDRDVFPYAEVREWLDRRTIARPDLRPGEEHGATYGDRLRSPGGPPAQDAPRYLATNAWKASLGRALDRLRTTAVDSQSATDLMLGLLYLAARHRDRWTELVTTPPDKRDAGVWGIQHAVPALPSTWHATWAQISPRTVAELVSFVDHLVRSVDPAAIGDVFRELVEQSARRAGRYGGVVTPRSLLRLLVELAEPEPDGRILDPFLETGDSLVVADRFLQERGGGAARYSGQSFRDRSGSIARMNLDLHGVPVDLNVRSGIELTGWLPDRRFDTVISNPPFNLTGVDPAGRSWPFGSPPAFNANFALLQQIWLTLSEAGRAAVVMANGAASSARQQEAAIRAAMVEAGVVEALVGLPPQLFSSTPIPVTVWLLTGPASVARGEILFLDARDSGRLIDRGRRELQPDDIRTIADSVTDWRHGRSGRTDVPGLRRSVPLAEVREQGYNLAPGRYVGARQVAATDRAVQDIRSELAGLRREAAHLDAVLERQLDRIDPWSR